ncbi:MAG: hypothetical protein A3C36_06230 [Omnitrophica WOR_2 bacterium RIFCSPHIGHO2_02_FULL_52_10]|nr:MAG: hypothetical protein A3C36_06230 [Omnitrophica WOR_2 bacterium RIFCSPHIGHO2_02_FULL_52_10]
MTKQYFNTALLLFCAWTVYGSCQGDTLLPRLAGLMIIATLLTRLRSGDKHYAFFARWPLSVIIFASLAGGFTWRGMFPPPQEAASPFPAVTAAFQSASVFAALLIWLKPFAWKNLYQLFFLSWLTVAVSINVPFTGSMLIMFCAFCVIAVAVVILHTSQKPEDKNYVLRYYRDFSLFALVLVMLTTGLFYGISQTIVIADQVFMDLVSDYIMPRHYTNFLSIEPLMRLGSPGRSAWDKRPVLELSAPGIGGFYLKTQIFEDFNDGVWLEQKNIEKNPLPDTLFAHMINGRMTMFTAFENIIPSPTGIAAARANSKFTKSKDSILYAEDEQRTRMLQFSMSLEKVAGRLTAKERRRNTAIPAEIAHALKMLSTLLIGGETDKRRKAELLQNFFLEHFRYSLNVNYAADNEGLIRMIVEKRPAYCTYFATALTMLLRAQDIPARVATGFLVDERISPNSDKLLARVFDAHAWVEVFLKETDPATGREVTRWQIMDPTPAGERAQAIKDSVVDISKITENIWLAALRFSAFMENLDREKLKKNMLLTLVLIMLVINGKKICLGALSLIKSVNRARPLRREKSDPLRSVYLRYEQCLKTAFGETRGATDTDAEVIHRLKTGPHVPEGTIAKAEAFIGEYHAARFGFRKNADFEQLIGDLEQAMSADRS